MKFSRWVERNTIVAIGAFLSGMFLLLGTIGTLVFFSRVADWRDAATWPSTTAEITGSQLAYTPTGKGRGVRPDFTFRYTWEGQEYTASGYDLLSVYSTNFDASNAILNAHPVGSRTTVIVNPAKPSQAVLTRGDLTSLALYAIPPFFVLLGLIGGTFTLAGWRGWLDPKSRHPFGRATRAAGGVLLRENVLKAIFFTVFGVVVVGLTVIGVTEGNAILVIVAGVFAWGVWKAARPR